MKTTVDLPEDLLEEARRLSGLPTKRAVLLTALAEFVHRHRKKQLLEMLGRTDIALTQSDLERLRGDDEDHEDWELRLVRPVGEGG